MPPTFRRLLKTTVIILSLLLTVPITARSADDAVELGYIGADGKLHLPPLPNADSLALDELYRDIDLIFPVADCNFHSLEYAEQHGQSDFRCLLRPNHYGVDIFASEGTDVLAAADGVVILSVFTPKGGPGHKIAIDHGNGVYTYYLHMSEREVHAGQVVEAGQKIAEVGATGNAAGTPPHLHFEVELGLEVQDRPPWYLDYVNFKPGIAQLRSTDPIAYICVREGDDL